MIDPMVPADAEAASALSIGFGWPHRAADWRIFLRLGHGLAWREDGVLRGTAWWIPLGPAEASIGLVQVAPALQGRGIGRRLMQAAMEAAAPRSLVLNATTEGAGLYAALGFVAGATVRQFQGVWTGPSAVMGAADRGCVAALDAQATGLARGALLDVLMEDATLATSGTTGYALRRHFGRGPLIGPVVAGSETEAIGLVNQLAQPGFVRIDIPAAATVLAEALMSSGLTDAGPGLTMTRGSWPQPTGPAQRWALAFQSVG